MRHEHPPEKDEGIGRAPQTLRDFLQIPFVLESQAVQDSAGNWLRRVSYPELPDCAAEAIVIEDAIRTLEQRRIRLIVQMLRDGREPPCPRPPLSDCYPEWIAREVGLGSTINQLLDKTAAELRYAADPFDHQITS
jgi:hypothetical protein